MKIFNLHLHFEQQNIFKSHQYFISTLDSFEIKLKLLYILIKLKLFKYCLNILEKIKTIYFSKNFLSNFCGNRAFKNFYKFNINTTLMSYLNAHVRKSVPSNIAADNWYGLLIFFFFVLFTVLRMHMYSSYILIIVCGTWEIKKIDKRIYAPIVFIDNFR